MRLKIGAQTFDWLLFLLLGFVILWKGGKALDATWMLVLVTSVIAIGMPLFTEKSERAAPSMMPWLLAFGFMLWSVLSFVLSTTKNVGFDEMLQTASLFLLFTHALSIPEERLQSFVSKFARVISAAVLIACGIGLVVYALQPVSRFVGTFFDYRFNTDYWPNAWAEFLLLAWPLSVWSLFCRNTDNASKRIGFVVISLQFGCLFLSYSRGALIALFAQMAFFCAFSLLYLRESLPVKKSFLGVYYVFLCAALFFMIANHIRFQFNEVESIFKKATFTASEGTSSVSERSQFWSQAVAFAKERPVFGFGPYSFRYLQPHMQTDVLATSDHPHNVFLKFAMERGSAAAILFALLVTVCVAQGLNAARRRQTKMHPLLLTFVLTSVVGVLLHNLIDYNLQFVAIAGPLWIGLGAIAARGRQNASGASARAVSVITMCVAVILLFFTILEGGYLWMSSSARRAETAGNFPEALSWYAKTDASLFPRDAWLSRSMILISSGTPEEAQTAINHALSLNAEDYRIWKLQGDLFLREKKFSDAELAFEKAYAYGKYNDLGITRVLIELLRKRPNELDERRHEFELLLNDFGLATLNNVHFIDLSSNVEELVKICELMKAIYESDASIYDSLSEKSLKHAMKERENLSSRPRGLLW